MKRKYFHRFLPKILCEPIWPIISLIGSNKRNRPELKKALEAPFLIPDILNSVSNQKIIPIAITKNSSVTTTIIRFSNFSGK